ncbi:MAG: outer membrane adhesin-like protein, partial [Planctomycetota bacterium]
SAIGDGPYDVLHGQTLMVSVPGILGNDTDFDGDVLTLTVVDQPAHGSLTVNGDGSFSYTPSSNTFTGADSFTYKVNDGLIDSDIVTVTLSVSNYAPGASDDYFSTGKDQVLSDNILNNDYEMDSDPVAITVLTQPSHGMISIGTNGSLSYTPDSGFVGTDSFTYQLNDGLEDSNVATVTIDVYETSMPLMGSTLSEDNSTVERLTPAQLRSVVVAAIQRWEAAINNVEITQALWTVDFRIADLPGTQLGGTYVESGVVRIDVNGAGVGWFIDQTPLTDERIARTRVDDGSDRSRNPPVADGGTSCRRG